MKQYAGIGSRSLSTAQKKFCFRLGRWLADLGWTLQTGAAKGADQAFAEGALSVGGTVHLCLPWDSYEEGWVNRAMVQSCCGLTVLRNSDHKHHASVDFYHPAPENLSGAVRKLHARNSLIITGCKFVLAYPGEQLGGTGQGIRIAEGSGIKVFRLDISEQRWKIEDKTGFKL